jgi:O-antigen ligase
VIVLIILGGVYVSLRPFQSSYYSLTWPILQFYANGSAGSLFWVWLFCIAISQLLLNNSLRLIWKAAIAFVLVMFLYSAFFIGRDWTSGWLPALAGGGVILFLVFKRARIPLVIVGLLVIALNWDQVRSVVMVGDNTYSLGTRLDAWKIMFKMISYNPILGFGPANYYFYTPLFPIRGYSVMFNSHNNYVDLLAQTGIIGTGLFIWLFAEVILLGFRLSKQVPQGFDRAFVYGVIGGAVGTLVAGMLGDWVIPFVYNVGFAGFRASLLGWFFMGALLALARFSKVVPNSQNP